jgi:hypothetical protein
MGGIIMSKVNTSVPRTPLERAQKKLKNYTHLLWSCRGMIIFGFVTSAAGNVLHAEHEPIPIGLSLLAPALLLYAFEQLSRMPLPPAGLPWYTLRYWGTGLRILAMFAIAGVTVIISYRHQSAAFLKYGNDELAATLLPGAIDAFMLVGSLSVLEIMIFIRIIEDRIAAIEMSDSAKDVDVPVVQEKPLTGREKIAMAFMDMPWASAKEIAAKAQVKENYAATVVSELKKARANANGNGHSTAGVTV